MIGLLLAYLKVKSDEVIIHLVSKPQICKLHADFFNDPSPTDCISFPMDNELGKEGYRVLGEIFVCPAVALEYAEEHGKDPMDELKLYLVHGILHLLGYDDIKPKDRQKMRRMEAECLKITCEKHPLKI